MGYGRKRTVLLIRNGYLIDPEGGHTGPGQLLLAKDRVVAVLGPNEPVNAGMLKRTLDAKGCLVTPAFLDLHAHLREPGFEHKEDITSGLKSAVAGGFGYVCAMPNTSPVNDNPIVTHYLLQKAKALGLSELLPVGATTLSQKGERLTDFHALLKAGCVGFSDDGRSIDDPLVFRDALIYTGQLDTVLFEHAESKRLGGYRGIHAGIVAASLGLEGSSALSETAVVARDVEILRHAKGRLHLTHISAKGSLPYVRTAKEEGLGLSVDVTPHHLLLTEEALAGFNTTPKVNPPLRMEDDRLALLRALKEGLIDAIATDHAPHTQREKDTYFEDAPSGVIGFESAFPALYGLVEKGELGLEKLVSLLSIGPAGVFGIKGIGLKKGSLPNLGVWRVLKEPSPIPPARYSKGKNCPFVGVKTKIKLQAFIADGRVIYEHERGFGA